MLMMIVLVEVLYTLRCCAGIRCAVMMFISRYCYCSLLFAADAVMMLLLLLFVVYIVVMLVAVHCLLMECCYSDCIVVDVVDVDDTL
jgi:hypothetical protein